MNSIFFGVMFLQAGMIITPGSDYALVMRTVAKKGKRAGILTAVGLGTGALVLFVLSVFGIDSLFLHYPLIATIVRFTGMAWLFWQTILCLLPNKNSGEFRQLGTFKTGFMNHFINIEMVIFYIAITTQLSVRNIGTYSQLMIAFEMAIFTAIWFIIIAEFSGRIPHGEKILNHIIARILFSSLFFLSGIALIGIA